MSRIGGVTQVENSTPEQIADWLAGIIEEGELFLDDSGAQRRCDMYRISLHDRTIIVSALRAVAGLKRARLFDFARLSD